MKFYLRWLDSIITLIFGIFPKGLAPPSPTWQWPGEAFMGLWFPECLESACQSPGAPLCQLTEECYRAASQRGCHSAEHEQLQVLVTGHCPQPSPRKSSTNDLYKLLLHVLFITANNFPVCRPVCFLRLHLCLRETQGPSGGRVLQELYCGEWALTSYSH